MKEFEIKKREELIKELVEEIISRTPNATEEERRIDTFIDCGNEICYSDEGEVYRYSDEELIDWAEYWVETSNLEHELMEGCNRLEELLKTNPTVEIIEEEFEKLKDLEADLQGENGGVTCEAVDKFEVICDLLDVDVEYDRLADLEEGIYEYLQDSDISTDIRYVEVDVVNEDNEKFYAVSIVVSDDYGCPCEFYELYPMGLGTYKYRLSSLLEDLKMYLADNEIDY